MTWNSANGGASDLLRWPLVGRALRWRHTRTAVQLVLLCAAALVVLHGLFGPQFAPGNLATVTVWIDYRGLLVIALLAVGNVFCLGCPLVRVRDWGRRLRTPNRRWPQRLRTKWPGLVLFATVLFCYELFDLWALPAATAYLVLGYFAAALAVDLLFSGASFCKYVCPIGQFNFIASTVSPLELRVRSAEVCRTCRTFDCIKGRQPAGQRGCELRLFLPSKVGNLDCTFCLDCVHACQYSNVTLAGRVPGAELFDARRRSGLGSLMDRWDIAALAVLFTFGGLLNAFAMTRAASYPHMWMANAVNASDPFALSTLFALGLLVLPLLLLGGAAGLTRRLVRDERHSTAATATRYAYALVPLGFGVWLAHSLFHLLTGIFVIIPASQRAALDLLGRAVLGQPVGHWTGMPAGDVLPLQIGAVLLGAAGSIAIAHALSQRDYSARAGMATIPWVAVVVAIASAAVWTFMQPMDMRGMAHGAAARMSPPMAVGTPPGD